jgi:hypothetical protein
LRLESRRGRIPVVTGNPLGIFSNEKFDAGWCVGHCGGCLASVAARASTRAAASHLARRVGTHQAAADKTRAPPHRLEACCSRLLWFADIDGPGCLVLADITKASGSYGARGRPLSASLGLRHLPRAPVRQSREICGLCQVSKHFGTPSHPSRPRQPMVADPENYNGGPRQLSCSLPVW